MSLELSSVNNNDLNSCPPTEGLDQGESKVQDVAFEAIEEGGAAFQSSDFSTSIVAEEVYEPEKKKGIKPYLQKVIPLLLLIGASGAEVVNTTHFHSSSLGTLGIRLWLYGLLFHSTREVLKNSQGLMRPIVQGSLIGTAAIVQGITNYFFFKKFSLFGSVFAIGLGVGSSFIAKDVRNIILPKDKPSTGYHYALNASLVAGSLVAQSFVNKLLGNDLVIGSKAASSGLSLIADYGFYCWTSNLLKGNLKHVDSYQKHYAAGAAFLGTALVSDFLVNRKIGETSMLASIILLGYLNKSICYVINGLKPFGFDHHPVMEEAEKKTRFILSQAWNATIATAVSAVNMVVPMGSPISSLVNQAYSAAYRKGVKADLKLASASSSKKERVRLITTRASIGSLASGIPAGVFCAMGRAGSDAWSILYKAGSVGAIIATNYFTDGLPRAFSKPKVHGHDSDLEIVSQATPIELAEVVTEVVD